MFHQAFWPREENKWHQQAESCPKALLAWHAHLCRIHAVQASQRDFQTNITLALLGCTAEKIVPRRQGGHRPVQSPQS